MENALTKLNDRVNEIKNYIRIRLGFPKPWERATILNRTYLVHTGTIRTPPDYDEAWLFALAHHAETMFDIGTNIGQAAFIALYPGKVREIVLVEANPKALVIAAENLIMNHLIQSSRLVCAFASDNAGKTVQFWTVGSGAAGSVYRTHAVTASRRGKKILVPTVTIDLLIDLYDFIPDLIKIDVEGAEYDVLQGAISCASQNRTRFFVEMHSNPESPMVGNARKVLNWCERYQYRAWYLSRKVELTNPEQLQDRGRCHLLIQPSKWDYPEWLKKIDQGASLESVVLDESFDHIH